MKFYLIVFTIIAAINGSFAGRLGIRSPAEGPMCKAKMEPEEYSLVNSVCEECADVFKNYHGVYSLCQ